MAQTPAVPLGAVKAAMVKGGDVVVVDDESGPVIIGPDGKPVATKGKAAKEPEKPKESERLAKLKTMTFDRRPSAQLKAWAPEPKKDDKVTAPVDPKVEALTKELAGFKKAVTLGEWKQVQDYLGTLPDEEAIVAYRQILSGLLRNPNAPQPQQQNDGDDEMAMMRQQMMNNPNLMRFAEKNLLTMDDVLGIAQAAPKTSNPKFFDGRAALVGTPFISALAPKGIDKSQVTSFTTLLSLAVQSGTLTEVLVARMKAEVAKPDAVFTKRQVAKMFVNGAFSSYAGDFLPTLDEAQKTKDFEALNLLSQHFLSLQAREEKSGNLEKAWNAVQSVLAVPDATREQQEEALLLSVELAPKVTEKLGQTWLDESFTAKPERGMDILSTVGTLVSQGITSKPFASEQRLNALKLLKTAVEALLKASPEKATQWKSTLTALAVTWMKEADFTKQFDRSTGSGPRIRRDVYGNIFYSSNMSDDEDDMNMRMMRMQGQQIPQAIATGDILRARPNDTWVGLVNESIRPKLADTLARLHLKVGEEDKAFPLIQEIAKNQKEEAKELVKEFLRVWTKNHDPNAARNENRYSWFFFAFEQRAEGIPLTRSKQERNVEELGEWLKKIRALPIPPLDDAVVVKAFTTCHSVAEVYKTEAIEKVLGPFEKLQPKTIAGLAQQMRSNLAGMWRDDRTQTRSNTKRKKKDLEAEVIRGYVVALDVVKDGLKKFPNHYALLTAQASLIHDQVNYTQELQKSTEFSQARDVAFALYEKAATEYGKVVKTMTEDEQNNDIFNEWFASSLGAVDLGMITEEKQPDLRQPERIKKALLALPGEAATKHYDRFANDLFTRLSGAKPHVKFRYLKGGFEIVGEHKQAIEAKKLFDYYKDLVTEIQLDVLVDGPADLGHGKPFGLFVNIRHTRDIERESGGFGKYLVNQNAGGYSYNYGRPTTDYRDRFEQSAKEALKENFEVISVTFQEEKVVSRGLPEIGWRYTPYAYILLKPRGPQVDKVPELRMDFDFLDTSGFVVLPVSSKTLPVNCKDAKGAPRPVKDLQITQTLDERQAEKGILQLEIKAVGLGLIPDLVDLAKFTPVGFDITKTEDPGVAVKKFDDDISVNAILSERLWTLTLKGQSGLNEFPKSFQFADVQLPTKESLFQRYKDADLLPVEPTISLEATYGTKSYWKYYLLAAGTLGIFIMGILLIVFMLTRTPKAPVESNIPKDLNALTMLRFLQNLRVSDAQQTDLQRDITTVEEHYFGNTGVAPDLGAMAKKWSGYA
jgi:hypothetical protein